MRVEGDRLAHIGAQRHLPQRVDVEVGLSVVGVVLVVADRGIGRHPVQHVPVDQEDSLLELGERTLDVCVELERHGVVTRPFADEGLRVTIGTPEENDKFLRALGDVGRNG